MARDRIPTDRRVEERLARWGRLNDQAAASPYTKWFRHFHSLRNRSASLARAEVSSLARNHARSALWNGLNSHNLHSSAHNNHSHQRSPHTPTSHDKWDKLRRSNLPSSLSPAPLSSATAASLKRKPDQDRAATEQSRQKWPSPDPTPESATPERKRKHGDDQTEEQEEGHSTKRLRQASQPGRAYTPEEVIKMVDASKHLQPTDADIDAARAGFEDIDLDDFDYEAAEDELQTVQKSASDAVDKKGEEEEEEKEEEDRDSLSQHVAAINERKQRRDDEAKAILEEEKQWKDWKMARNRIDEAVTAEQEDGVFHKEYKERQTLIEQDLQHIASAPAKAPTLDVEKEDTDYYNELVRSCLKNVEKGDALLALEEKNHQDLEKDRSTKDVEYWLAEIDRCEANARSTEDETEKKYWMDYKNEALYRMSGNDVDADDMNELVQASLAKWRIEVDARTKADEESIKQQERAEGAAEDPSALEAQRQRLFPFINPLPEEWDDKVDAILGNTDMRKVVGKSVDGVEISRSDVAKVIAGRGYVSNDPAGWLNDEIVNAFYANLVDAMNVKAGYVKGPRNVPPFATYVTAWYETVKKSGVQGIARWSRRKGIKGESLLECEKIFFPINAGNHWTLLVISGKDRIIEYLDSLDYGTDPDRRKSTQYIKIAREWLKMELAAKYDADEWRELDRRSSIQNNGSDCGVFACLNGLVLAFGIDCPTDEFGPENIPDARRVMIAMISNGGFTGPFGV
ncbi:hypothetical protein MBLNU459_g1972t3 [Dothideomycetes sp. NU459]